MKNATIELDESMVIESGAGFGKRKKKNKWTRFSFFLVKAILFLVVIVYFSNLISRTYTEIYSNAKIRVEMAVIKFKDQFGIVKYEVVSPQTDKNTQTLVEHFSQKYGISPAISWAVIDKESSMNPSRVRYEESWKRDYGKNFPKGSMNDIEYDLLFSSYGLMQVSYPIWHNFCGIKDYSQLLVKEINIECGIKILSKCLYENRQVFPQSKRIRGCFREYNGSGPRAEAYANDLMSKLANYMLDEDKIVNAYTELKRQLEKNA